MDHAKLMKKILGESRQRRIIKKSVTTLSLEEIKAELKRNDCNTEGNLIVLKDRLLRYLLRKGEPDNEDIPWYESDILEEIMEDSVIEDIMEYSDHEKDREDDENDEFEVLEENKNNDSEENSEEDDLDIQKLQTTKVDIEEKVNKRKDRNNKINEVSKPGDPKPRPPIARKLTLENRERFAGETRRLEDMDRMLPLIAHGVSMPITTSILTTSANLSTFTYVVASDTRPLNESRISDINLLGQPRMSVNPNLRQYLIKNQNLVSYVSTDIIRNRNIQADMKRKLNEDDSAIIRQDESDENERENKNEERWYTPIQTFQEKAKTPKNKTNKNQTKEQERIRIQELRITMGENKDNNKKLKKLNKKRVSFVPRISENLEEIYEDQNDVTESDEDWYGYEINNRFNGIEEEINKNKKRQIKLQNDRIGLGKTDTKKEDKTIKNQLKNKQEFQNKINQNRMKKKMKSNVKYDSSSESEENSESEDSVDE